jgi:hypothetical protein
MTLDVKVQLSDAELTALAQLAGASFMSAPDMERVLRDIIKRELAPGIDLGWGFGITYYREDPRGPQGFTLFNHVFQGRRWPHVWGRPRFYYDGKSIRTRGGAFTVDARRGVIDTRPKGGDLRNVRTG